MKTTRAKPPRPLSLGDLVADPANRRTHNARNLAMIGSALEQVGAARSIVIDEDDVILAGNGVTAAALAAGLTRVRVIDSAGDELIAVRRSGLSAEQKRALAIYDNRTAELAEWNAEQLRLDGAAGLTLEPWWTPEELERATSAFDAAAGQAPELPSGDRAPIQQMTFTLHDDQVETVRAALALAREHGGAASDQNDNGNGNALAFVCARFLQDG